MTVPHTNTNNTIDLIILCHKVAFSKESSLVWKLRNCTMWFGFCTICICLFVVIKWGKKAAKEICSMTFFLSVCMCYEKDLLT